MNILGHARFWIIDVLRGTNIVATLKKLRKEQYLDYKTLSNLSHSSYKNIIEKVIPSTQYYSNLGTSVATSVLTKDIIRKNTTAFFSKSFTLKKFAKGTGGSTGAPLVYYTTNEAQSFMWAGILLSWETLGYQLGDKVAFVAGTSLGKNDLKHTVFHQLMNVTTYSAYHLNDSDIQSYLIRIINSKTKIIYGYATAINRLAEYILKTKTGYIFPDLKGIVTTAEILSDKHRDNIGQAFNVKVHNQYGCNEAGISAFECDFGNLHYINTATKIEFDNDGNVLATNLINKAFPMVRYYTGDKFEVVNQVSCPCKRGYPIIENFMGRTCDLVIDKRNKVMHSAFFNVLFRDNKHIEQFQVQFNEHKLTIYLQLDNNSLPQEIFTHYLDVIKSILEFDEYAIEINAPFLEAENAKHRYVINTSPIISTPA
jgi:phenylacetate-CoA ligase